MDRKSYRLTTRLQMVRKQAAEQMLRLDNQICFAIYSTAHAFNRVYKPLLDALQLTYPQYLVMLGLWQRDGVTVKQIGEQLHLDSGTLTPLLKRLESAGLVRRARDAADERQVRISLTPKGTALREKARTVGHGVVDACQQSRDELKTLNAQLVKLRDKLNAS
jgi:DNA-binding MarR family transcriptional regulator